VPGGRQDRKLPGQEYHTVLAVRTKPGRGDPTASLSCSDKLSKWCVVGVQGALLSLLLDTPIFLASVVLPSNCPYSEESLKRALLSRLPENCARPQLLQSSVPFPHSKDSAGRPCPTSLIWSDCSGEGKTEVAVDGRRHGLTKARASTPVGRLKVCKRNLFSLFCEVAPALGFSLGQSETYREVKNKAEEYQLKWDIVRDRAFPEWPQKNAEFEEFALN